MSVNMGKAVGYLDLDTTKFKAGFKSALADLKVFQSQTATSSDKLAAFSSAATSTGRILTKSLTVPLAGIAAASVAVTAKFDAGMSKVKAISGATTEDMEKLRAKAKEMGAQTKFSASQSAEAFSYMAMAGWKTEDMLNGIEGVMNLAAASGEDLATTSDIVTDAITAFGLKAEDSAHFADVLAAASSNANTNVSMMGETFKYVAPVAGALGFSVEDISTAIGLMANSGIKGSQAGTALRNIFTRMVKPTKASAKVMDELGISITDSEGKMKSFDTIMGDLRKGFAGLSEAEKAQAASALAGQYGMSGLLAIVNSSDKDFNKLKESIYNADGAAEDMAATMMDNLPGAITLAKSALEGLGIRIGEVITPAVTKIVKVFTSFISWLSQASDGTVKFAVGMGVLLGSIGPVLLITGTLAGSILNLIKAYKALSKILAGEAIKNLLKSAAAKMKDVVATTADTIANIRYQAALRNTSSINVMIGRILALAAAHKVAVGAIFGIIGVLVGLFIYMKKTGTSFSELKDKAVNMFNSILEKAPEIINTIKSVVSEIIQKIPEIFNRLTELAPQIFNAIMEVSSNVIKQIPTLISSAFSALGSFMSQALSGLGQLALTSMESLREIFPQVLKWWANDMPKLIEMGGNMAVELINGFSETLTENIDQFSETLVTLIDSFTANLPAYIDAGLQIAMSLIEGILQTLPNLIEAGMQLALAMIQGLVQVLPNIVTSIVSVLSNSIGPIIQAALSVLLQIANVILTNLPVILQAVVTIITALIQAIVDNAPAIITAALKLMIALASGIIQALPQIIVAAAKIALALIQAVLAIVGSMVGAGVKIIQALWRGIQSWAGTLRSKVRGVGKKVLQAIKSGIGNLLSAGREWIVGLWNGIKAKVGSVTSNLKSAAKKIPKAAKSAIGSLYGAGKNFIQGLWDGMSSKISGVIEKLRSKLETIKNLASKIFKEHSPSKVTFQQGVWFMQGLEEGMAKAYKPLMRTLNRQMEDIVAVYNPLSDYDFRISESADQKMLSALTGLSERTAESTGTNNVITQNITVDGAENPQDFAEKLARQLKISMRTV